MTISVGPDRATPLNAMTRRPRASHGNGKATSIASVLEIDEVIDPAKTRGWIMTGLRLVPKPCRARTASVPASTPGWHRPRRFSSGIGALLRPQALAAARGKSIVDLTAVDADILQLPVVEVA